MGGERSLFNRIAIVGFGLVGGSIALAVRKDAPHARVVAIDCQSVVDQALRLRAADDGGEDLALADAADLVVLAAPVRQNVAILDALPARVSTGALVTDVGGTKRAIVDRSRALPSRFRFVGGHPLAGAAAAGVAAARADLFRARPWIFTPEPHTRSEDLARLEAFVSRFGSIPRTMDVDAHDRLMAYLSHLPQLTVSALMKVVGDHAGAEWLHLAGGGLRDTTRLASSPASTWRDVASTNAEAVSAALDDLIDALTRLKLDLSSGDELQRVFESAGEWKRILDDPAPPGRTE